MGDLFEREQQMYDQALLCAAQNGEAFRALVKEYGMLLKHVRMLIKITDRITSELITNKQDLTNKVYYDVLTGICNRRFMEENLQLVIKSLSRHNGLLSVMMLDIDSFKKYNDRHGHSEGDVCLRIIAETIAGCLYRTDDFAARYGGEEFAVILPNTDESGARVMANAILTAIRACAIPCENGNAEGCVTISIGVTTGTVVHGQRGEDYLKRADEALYQSKQSGRNRYTFIAFEEGNMCCST